MYTSLGGVARGVTGSLPSQLIGVALQYFILDFKYETYYILHISSCDNSELPVLHSIFDHRADYHEGY